MRCPLFQYVPKRGFVSRCVHLLADVINEKPVTPAQVSKYFLIVLADANWIADDASVEVRSVVPLIGGNACKGCGADCGDSIACEVRFFEKLISCASLAKSTDAPDADSRGAVRVEGGEGVLEFLREAGYVAGAVAWRHDVEPLAFEFFRFLSLLAFLLVASAAIVAPVWSRECLDFPEDVERGRFGGDCCFAIKTQFRFRMLSHICWSGLDFEKRVSA